jgi:glycosyltransferase involved in cell wall biosynthesis
MKVWLDLTGLLQHSGRPTGIQRVAMGVARSLLDGRDVQPAGFCHYRKKEGFHELSAAAVESRLAGREMVVRDWRRVRKARRRVQRLLGLPDATMRHPFARGDVLLNPGFLTYTSANRGKVQQLVHAAGVPYVGMIYDLIQIRFPEWFDIEQQEMVADWHRFTARTSAAILCISEATRRDARAFYERQGVVAPPLHTIALSDEIPKAAAGSRAHPAGRPFVLFVSTIEPRKNHRLLFQVWRRLVAERGADAVPDLVFVGREGWQTKDFLLELRQSRLLDGKIQLRTDVDDDELARLYAECLFTVYPSITEGWGLPVSESLAHGKFCVASNVDSLPEVGRDWIDYHDPFDVAGATALIARAIDDKTMREAREERIRREYRPRSWRQVTDDLVRMLAEVAR